MAVFRLIAVSFVCLFGAPTSAQTQVQQDRLDRVAQFIFTAPMCEKLGMKIDPEIATSTEVALKAEAALWPIELARLEKLSSEAISRQSMVFATDLKAASEGANTDAQLRAVRGILLSYGRTCMAASVDPIFSKLIVAPTGYELEKSATAVADSMLEAGGLASWQTPKIRARGDLMMVAGACRSKIGPARSDTLVREFGRADDPRIRDYYSKSFDEGLSDPTMITTLAGCNRAITAYRAKIQQP